MLPAIMSRPIRIEFPNALYHVTSRGDRREAIFEDDEDHQTFLQTLGQAVRQFNWLCHAWCLMDHHYHLFIQTPDGNWSKGMRQLLGDERFVERMQKRAGPTQREDIQIPMAHRRAPAASLRQIEKEAPDRNAAIVRAHASGTYSCQQIAAHFGIHFTTVGRIVRGSK